MRTRAETVAIVQTAIDYDRAAKEITDLLAQVREGEAAITKATRMLDDWRCKAGQRLAEVRKSIPARGPKAKRWTEFLQQCGITDDTALNYMKLAEYIAVHPEAAISGMSVGDVYKELGIGEKVSRSTSGNPVDNFPSSQPAAPAPAPERKTAPLMSSASECWLTPAEICDLLVAFVGEEGIALDPCSHKLSIIPADCQWCGPPGIDGLSQRWQPLGGEQGQPLQGAPGLIFCNPPYGRALGDWADKIAIEAAGGGEIIALVPARVDTGWWATLMEHAAGWLAWSGRLRFLEPVQDWQARHPGETPPEEAHPGLVETDPAPFPSALIYFGPRWARFAELFGMWGQPYPLRVEPPAPPLRPFREVLFPPDPPPVADSPAPAADTPVAAGESAADVATAAGTDRERELQTEVDRLTRELTTMTALAKSLQEDLDQTTLRAKERLRRATAEAAELQEDVERLMRRAEAAEAEVAKLRRELELERDACMAAHGEAAGLQRQLDRFTRGAGPALPVVREGTCDGCGDYVRVGDRCDHGDCRMKDPRPVKTPSPPPEAPGFRLGDQVLWARRRSKGRTDPTLRAVVVTLEPRLFVWVRPQNAPHCKEAKEGIWWEDQLSADELSPDPQAEDPAVAIRAAIDALAKADQCPEWQAELRAELQRREAAPAQDQQPAQPELIYTPEETPDPGRDPKCKRCQKYKPGQACPRHRTKTPVQPEILTEKRDYPWDEQ